MKIALTGGSGGVGREIIAQALARGHSIVSIDRVVPDDQQDRENLTFIEADITDYDRLVDAFAGCDAMIHMAAIPNPNLDLDHIVHNNNVVGSYNALRAAVEHGIMRLCLASSVNAIGHSFSRVPRHDYFPIDELHPNYNEDPYSLSKWICEAQGDSFARRYDDISIASMRFHLIVPDRSTPDREFGRQTRDPAKHLWAYSLVSDAADACLLSLTADFKGHEVFYIVSPDTTSDTPSLDLAAKHFPDIPVQGDLRGHNSFISSDKAVRMLGWQRTNTEKG